MDSQIMESLAGFDALWQRVTGREEPEPNAPAERTYGTLADAMERLIREQSRAAACAAALARMTQGQARAALTRQAAECRQRLRRVQAEHYILTGATAVDGGDFRPGKDRLGALRDAFLQAQRLAELYGQTARLADDCPELARTLDGSAAGEQARARQLRELLVESF